MGRFHAVDLSDEVRHFIAVRCPRMAGLPVPLCWEVEVPVRSGARDASRRAAWYLGRMHAWDWAAATAMEALRWPAWPVARDPAALAAAQANAGPRAWYAAQDAAADAARAMVVRGALAAADMVALLAPWQQLEARLLAYLA